MELANGSTGSATGDSGIVIERGDDTNVFMGWDEANDKFVLGTTNATESSTGAYSWEAYSSTPISVDIISQCPYPKFTLSNNGEFVTLSTSGGDCVPYGQRESFLINYKLQNNNYGLISSNGLSDAISNNMMTQQLHYIKHNSGTIMSIETEYIDVNDSGNTVYEAKGRPIFTFIGN